MQHRPSYAKTRNTLLLFGLVLLVWALYSSFFIVDVTEYGVVTRLGRVIRVIKEPGLQLKLPSPIERVVRVEQRLLHFHPVPAEYLTIDKKNLVVHSLVTWKIMNPQRFLETVSIRSRAEAQIADIILAEIGSVLGRYPFAALISSSNQHTQFQAVVMHIRDQANRVILPIYGIAVIDVRLRQLNLPEQNKRYVFDRMKAERGKMTMQYRSEGEREAKKIIAAAEREKTRILAEAYQEAARLKGEGEAEAMRIYATAFRKNPEFYKFLRTLQAYEKILDTNTTIFLPSEAEIFQILHPARTPEEHQ